MVHGIGDSGVDITLVGDKLAMSGHLTNKERLTLTDIGKIKRPDTEQNYTLSYLFLTD